MLDICLLGTGGMTPLPYRFLTSMIARFNGSSVLIDCGEGTQVALRKKGWSPKPVDVICFTHFHADHISGLPGFLLSMANADRTEPVLMVGPKGLSRVVASLRVIARDLPFVVDCIELDDKEHIINLDGMRIKAFKVSHSVPCYGYSIEIDRAGRFDAEAAKALGLDVKYWSKLQKGETVTINGREYYPSMVMGEARKGLKVTYCTDSRPTHSITENARDADLFICEGMYGDIAELEKAKDKKHMTFFEAAAMAAEAGAQRLWLTHYSPSLNHPADYLEETQKIFEKTEVCKDGTSISLVFEDEELSE